MVETSESEDMESLLDQFGRLLVQEFDSALDSLRNRLQLTSHEMQRQFQAYLASLTLEERMLAIAQEALETFTHDLMFALEESEKFKIVALTASGNCLALRDDSMEGIHATQMNWREAFSRYGLLEDRIRDHVGATKEIS